MVMTTWGTLTRENAESLRKTRGLGLGAAVRKFNDLAVPGLGGLWFAKPMMWSLLGIRIGGETGARPAQVANAIEALACWHALKAEAGERSNRIGGRTKLRGVGPKFAPYSKASRREFYVTVPMRQGMVQPLRALGLVVDGPQRFNAYMLTDAGEELLEAACVGFRPRNRDLTTALTMWVRGSKDDPYIESSQMGDAISPMTPMRAAAASLLRERVLTGPEHARRRAIRGWVRALRPSAREALWTDRPPEIDEVHWADLREGARFFLMRDAALQVLDGVEAAVGGSATTGLRLAEAATAVTRQVAAVRSAATLFASADRDPTGLAAPFAKKCLVAEDAEVVRALVDLDGRGLRLEGELVRPGSAFGAGPDGATHGTGEPAATGAPEVVTLPLPAGISQRVRNMHALDMDIDAAIGAAKAGGEA